MGGYDGELNSMTFNHIKGSKVFDSKRSNIEITEEDMP
jgi:hypothetical protein